MIDWALVQQRQIDPSSMCQIVCANKQNNEIYENHIAKMKKHKQINNFDFKSKRNYIVSIPLYRFLIYNYTGYIKNSIHVL